MAGKMVLYKLVVLGDGGVGKTALTIQLTLQHFVETYDPTIEDSYRKQVVIDGQSCMLEVLDTAGQEEYTALRDQWIRDGEGFVLVYSISSRSSFNRITNFHTQIQQVKESSTPVPIMLVGNKSDRVTEREVSTQEGQARARELGCEFVEASAKACINVEKAFYDVVRWLRRQRMQTSNSRHNSGGGRKPPPGDGPSQGRIYRPTKKKGGCIILCSGEKPAYEQCLRPQILCVYKVTTRKAAPRTDYMAILDKSLKKMEERIAEIVPKENIIPGTTATKGSFTKKRGADEALGSDLDTWSISVAHPNLDTGPKLSSRLIQEAEESKLLCEGSESLPAIDIQEHLSEIFFENLYGQTYYLLHKPIFMRKLKSGTLPPVLVLAAIRMAYALQLHKDLDHDPQGRNGATPLSFIDREIRRRTMWACFLMDRFNSSGTDRPAFIKEENLKIPLPIKEKYFQLDMPGPTENLKGEIHQPVTHGIGELSNPKNNMGVAASVIKITQPIQIYSEYTLSSFELS
ncbi:ras family-domain-containing protein [Bisporella sp. PMI_857]|nr:ras family-domain-containing protein [Bisporella sp. PMI_857]